MTDYITEEPVEGMLELPDCAPTKVLPKDLSDAIGGKNVQKHYASTLVGIDKDESIPNGLFDTELSNLPQTKTDFFSKVIGLLRENDVCDKIGIQFLSKVYSEACSIKDGEFGKELCKEIRSSKSAVAKLAILYEKENNKI
jgi:hypothetical protein